MMPPHLPHGAEPEQPGGDPAVFVVSAAQDAMPEISALRQRADFLKAAQARRAGTAGFLLQARRRWEGEPAATPIRIGFTCSKKLGNAVARNRAKRRLRAIARAVMPAAAQPGWDYVLVGRPGETISRPFSELQADLVSALRRVHAPREPK